jgi:hypothetical protein
MELVILFLLIAVAVAAGILIASHFGVILLGVLGFVAIVLVGAVAWLAIGMVVGVPLSFLEARFARIPAPTRQRMEVYARWTLKCVAAALGLWIIGAVVCYRVTT